MEGKKLLEDYVESADPEINKKLRKGDVSQDALLFDSLFKSESVPILYRWMPNCYIHFVNDIYKDPAYLSCSENVDTFFEHVTESDLALLIIKLQDPTKCINVNSQLENHSDEGEYILPRDLELKRTKETKYEGTVQFKLFSKSIDNLITETLLESLQIKSIMVYELEEVIMKEENLSEVKRVLEEWRNSVSPKSHIEKMYKIDGDEISLTLLVSFKDEPTKDKAFIHTCKADVSSVMKAINELEEYKASSF